MNKSAPEGWGIVPLGEFCLGVRGVSYKPEDLSPAKAEHTVTLLRSNNIQSGRLVLADVQNVNQAKVSKKQLACEGDIAVCMSNGSKRLVGKSAVFRNIPQGTKYTVGAFCSIFRPLDSMSSGFVAQLLSSDQFKHQVDFSLAGSAINNLKNSDVIEYQFLKPPLPEQQKIAAILSSVDDVIEKTRAQIDKLKDLKTGMMQELLTKGIGHTKFKDSPVGRIPASWKIEEIQNILRKIIDYRGKSPPKSESGIPLITAKNIRQGHIAEEPREYIVEEQYHSWMVRGIPSEGDVFITTEAPLGNVARVPSYKFAIGQRVLALCPSETVDSDFLLYVMQSRYFREQLDLQSTGSTVAGIKQSTFRKIPVALPPLNEQRKITQPLNALSDRTNNTIRKLNQLSNLKKALMQDLLTGKVRVKVDQKESAVA